MRVIWTIFLFLSFKIYASSLEKKDVFGQWYNVEKTAVIEIYQETDQTLSGKIIWLKEPLDKKGNPKTDYFNPDKTLRNRLILNMKILYGFIYKGNQVWGDGRVYDVKSGKLYGGTITLKDKDRLDLKGYLLRLSFIGRTSQWSRKK